jgi:3-dehydroquinate synthase
VGYDLLPRFGQYIQTVFRGTQVAVVTHPRVMRLYGETVFDSLVSAGFSPVLISVPEGERNKTLGQVHGIYDQLIRHRFERSSLLIALGGGVVGDMTGFAAATFLRGISYVQCPTTVVGQVDAAIGGKTGVDHPGGKNLIGAFHQPSLVFIDPATLGTLPKREFVAGLAEVIKYGIIADPDFFSFLERSVDLLLARDRKVLGHCVRRSAQIKTEVVASDERESGRRKILNYGHTIGHAVETVTHYRDYKHGEAVSIGMAVASRIACQMGLLAKEAMERQIRLLVRMGLPVRLPPVSVSDLVAVMKRDKKVEGGKIYFVLAERMGSVRVVPIEQERLGRFLKQEV